MSHTVIHSYTTGQAERPPGALPTRPENATPTRLNPASHQPHRQDRREGGFPPSPKFAACDATKVCLVSGIKAYPTSGTKQSSTAEPRGLMARETPFLQDALRRKNSSQSAARLRQRCCPCLEKRRQGAFLATRKVPKAKWAGTRHRHSQS